MTRVRSLALLAAFLGIAFAGNAAQFGDFTYEITQSTITVARYTGSGGAVTIPDTINGLPVTGIGDNAFFNCTNLTSVTIPNSVTCIPDGAFFICTSLTSVTIPSSVTSIGSMWGSMFGGAFGDCISLTSVTILNSVTSIGEGAFLGCTSLRSVYFNGNAPSVDSNVFDPINVTVYYLPGTTGWGATLAECPTALWRLPNPLILTTSPSLGLKTNGFGFIISWATNASIAVEASSNLANGTWSPVATNTLTSGSSYFNDPQWTNYPSRFYRLRSP